MDQADPTRSTSANPVDLGPKESQGVLHNRFKIRHLSVGGVLQKPPGEKVPISLKACPVPFETGACPLSVRLPCPVLETFGGQIDQSVAQAQIGFAEGQNRGPPDVPQRLLCLASHVRHGFGQLVRRPRLPWRQRRGGGIGGRRFQNRNGRRTLEGFEIGRSVDEENPPTNRTGLAGRPGRGPAHGQEDEIRIGGLSPDQVVQGEAIYGVVHEDRLNREPLIFQDPVCNPMNLVVEATVGADQNQPCRGHARVPPPGEISTKSGPGRHDGCPLPTTHRYGDRPRIPVRKAYPGGEHCNPTGQTAR
jgi:hypothetical protein